MAGRSPLLTTVVLVVELPVLLSTVVVLDVWPIEERLAA